LNRNTLLPMAYLLDQIAGDPEWFPHPVRLIGFAISRGEAVLRRRGQSGEVEFVAGALLTLAVVSSTYWLTATMIRRAQLQSSFLGNTTQLLLASTCLAARDLQQEATAVVAALGDGDMALARRRLARIVGRDTQGLDSQEISRAVIETVAESASDGIIAPLFYMALGGVPLAMAYKAVNTLDSMIGHADSRYLDFGKAAARLDDVANYIPARATALALVGASQLSSHADPHTAWRLWRRDGGKHKSPNAGRPESAIAGALHVALGGGNTYAGEVIPAQRMGQEFPPATPEKSIRAIHLVSTASLLALAGGVILATLIQRRRR
jgi:adenosylcobinamide-phosphate synthase